MLSPANPSAVLQEVHDVERSAPVKWSCSMAGEQGPLPRRPGEVTNLSLHI
jgi:hypothetical protein